MNTILTAVSRFIVWFISVGVMSALIQVLVYVVSNLMGVRNIDSSIVSVFSIIFSLAVVTYLLRQYWNKSK